MIKIERKEGVVFVNEKEIISCEHNKKKEVVNIWRCDGSTSFTHVENVLFCNKNDIEWKENGTTVEKLQAKIEEHEKLFSALRRGHWHMVDLLNVYEGFRDKVFNLLKDKEMPELANEIITQLDSRLDEVDKHWKEIEEKYEK